MTSGRADHAPTPGDLHLVERAEDDPTPTADGKGERTRRAILDIATEQFAALGFRSASVPAIAREVGVSPSAVYAYFDTKAQLFEAAVDADVAGLLADALPDVLAGTFDRDFVSVFQRLIGNLGRHPLARRILEGHEGTGVERLVVLPAEAQLQRGLAEALRAGQASGQVRSDIDPEVMAAGLEAVVIALLIATLQTGGLVDSSHARGTIAVLDAALRPAPT